MFGWKLRHYPRRGAWHAPTESPHVKHGFMLSRKIRGHVDRGAYRVVATGAGKTRFAALVALIKAICSTVGGDRHVSHRA